MRVIARSGVAIPSRNLIQVLQLRGFILLYDSREATTTLPQPVVPRSVAGSRESLGVLNPRDLATQVAAFKSEGPMPEVRVLRRAAHVGTAATGAIEHVGLQE